MRHVVPAVATLLAAAALAAPALAHEGDPRYDSVLTGEPPRGIDVQVLNYGDRLSLRNETGETVVVEGYEKEPYARLLPDGTVQVNTRSPASYLNDDPYADAPVPGSAMAVHAMRHVDRAAVLHRDRVFSIERIPARAQLRVRLADLVHRNARVVGLPRVIRVPRRRRSADHLVPFRSDLPRRQGRPRAAATGHRRPGDAERQKPPGHPTAQTHRSPCFERAGL